MPASSDRTNDPAKDYLRTTFLERIAHELRGPAGVTAGALDEIERAIGPQAEDLKPFFSMARRGIGRILRSAARLERTAHLEGHALGAAPETADLHEVVAAAVHDAEGIEARRGIRVEVTASEPPCLVAADVPWARAAIAEVVSNAIRFARAAVSIDTRLVDGEAFARGGLGLSLPLVSDVMRAHGGRLSIHDRKSDEGATAGTRVVVAFRPQSL